MNIVDVFLAMLLTSVTLQWIFQKIGTDINFNVSDNFIVFISYCNFTMNFFEEYNKIYYYHD
jgi:hypothetical protein